MPNFLVNKLSLILLVLAVERISANCQELTINPTAANCYNEKSGRLLVKYSGTAAPFIFVLSADSLRKSEIKRSPLCKKGIFVFDGLPGGRYFVSVLASNGKVNTVFAHVEQPSQLLPGKIIVRTNPTREANKGEVVARVSGGSPPYSYKWQGAMASGNDSVLSEIPNGIYKCEIKDSHGCGPVAATVLLKFKASAKDTGLVRRRIVSFIPLIPLFIS